MLMLLLFLEWVYVNFVVILRVGGSTYCFTAVSVGVLVGVSVGVTPITKAPPCSNFFGVSCFLFPRSLAFDFCYDLDIWGQGQALRAFFVVMSFFTILSKV